jgi:hypothetical protein
LLDEHVESFVALANGAVCRAVPDSEHGAEAINRLQEPAELQALHFELVLIHKAAAENAIVT